MSKYIFLLSLLAFILSNCRTKDSCALIHTGSFYYFIRSQNEKISVVRTESLQIETNSQGIEQSSPIMWTSPCSFDMLVKPTPEVLQAWKVTAIPDLLVHVRIIKVSKNYYISEANANYNGKYNLDRIDTLYYLNK